MDSTTFLWSEVDDPETECIIEVSEPDMDTVPQSGNKLVRRRYKSGREPIYPYTGIALEKWGQYGDYNSSAPQGVSIGCPAMAVGMLLYDVCNRIDGINQETSPYFDYTDMYYRNAKSVSKRMRQIADGMIDYHWGTVSGGSGIDMIVVELALQQLGFKNAKLEKFSLSKAYENMCMKGTDYFGKEQTFHGGILLEGRQKSAAGGSVRHVWFCDGYYEREIKVTTIKRRLFKKKKTVRYEYEDVLYMNWGLENSSNGWYAFWEEHAVNGKYTDDPRMITGLNYFKR